MSPATTDRIEKKIELHHPRARVWRALTDTREFGSWFGVALTGRFEPGARLKGKITHAGYEHMTMDITIERMEPDSLFSWRWHPGAVEPGEDVSREPPDRCGVRLRRPPHGTAVEGLP
jgi:uncharacterized protein YndB with AHSA1/START domain